ncbi:hypothetical protein B566_EDAN001664 [Ephemera danica]|nr:hypothetical protein B566_EDAN001664 [Ephemera danica]
MSSTDMEDEEVSEWSEWLTYDPLSSWWPWIFATVVGLVGCVRNYMGGTDCPTPAHIEGKVVVITGASSGIGFETANELARRGANLVFGCRNIVTGESAANIIRQEVPDVKITVLPLDLCSFASIRQFAKSLDDHDISTVDVLINNAGVALHPETRTEDGHEVHFQANYLGHFLLTHLLLPRMREHGGRIINVSASAHHAGTVCLENLDLKGSFSARAAFSQSKLALVMMATEMASRLEDSGVTVNALHPGLVRGTQHLRYSPLSGSMVLRVPTLPWLWLLAKTAKQGAQTTIFLAVEPKLAEVSGKFFADCEEKEPASQALDLVLRRKLYEQSCKLVNVQPI